MMEKNEAWDLPLQGGFLRGTLLISLNTPASSYLPVDSFELSFNLVRLNIILIHKITLNFLLNFNGFHLDLVNV